jgi:hypothetical protein
MESVKKKQLRKKKTELKAEFNHHKNEVAKIDNLIDKLQNQKEEHRVLMIKAQGGYAIIDEILGPDESAKNKIKDKNHGNTNNIQGPEGGHTV